MQGDEEKTEQLELLKKENSQLLLTLTHQVESRMEATFLGICEIIHTCFFLYSVTYLARAGRGKGLRRSHRRGGISWLFSETSRRGLAPLPACCMLVSAAGPSPVCARPCLPLTSVSCAEGAAEEAGADRTGDEAGRNHC